MSPNLNSSNSQSVSDASVGQKADLSMDVSLSGLLRNWTSYSGKEVSFQGLLHQSLEDITVS